MAAHRYWRVNAINIPGGGYLEIGEWNLYSGTTRVDASATISASHTPSLGAVTDLKDGNVSTRCFWSEATAEGADFWIKWDFGTAQAVDGSKFSGFDTSNRYPNAFTLQWSDNGTDWTTQGSASGIPYPGNLTFTALISLAPPTYLTGTVKNSAGQGVARTVRAYLRSTGELVGTTTSNAATGAFSIQAAAGAEHYVVALDSANQNARIFDRVLPA